jgi:hypothetical protein
MISYHLVAFDHSTDTFQFENELLKMIMDKGDSYTEVGSHEYEDIIAHDIPINEGWHWAKDDVETDGARWFSYELLRRALNYSNNKYNPKAEEL